jgi:hypothetical protein
MYYLKLRKTNDEQFIEVNDVAAKCLIQREKTPSNSPWDIDVSDPEKWLRNGKNVNDKPLLKLYTFQNMV